MKSAEWRCDGERAVADFVDGMALRAMHAHECQASLRGRRLGEDRTVCRYKESSHRDHHPAVSGGIRQRHSSLSFVARDDQPAQSPERFSRYLVALVFGHPVGSQSGERRRVGTIFLPSRIGRFRCELVRASPFASTDRTHPLKISHDLRLDFRDFLSIELDVVHPRIQQIRGIRPFASESEELGSADAYVAGDALRFGITATIKIGHRPASAAPVLPPMRNPTNKARPFTCLSGVGHCNLHTVRVSRPTH